MFIGFTYLVIGTSNKEDIHIAVTQVLQLLEARAESLQPLLNGKYVLKFSLMTEKG